MHISSPFWHHTDKQCTSSHTEKSVDEVTSHLACITHTSGWSLITCSLLVFCDCSSPCVSSDTGIAWSGCGLLNQQTIDSMGQREFLVTPGHPVTIENTSADADLIVFTVFPLTHYPK